MDKIIKAYILEELNKLKYNEVMIYEDIVYLFDKVCYDYSYYEIDRSSFISNLYDQLYS